MAGDGFAKLYGDKLLRSTLWLEPPEVRLVFISMLSIADADGVVDVPGVRVLANVLNLPVDYVERALAILEAPDPDSRSPEEGGRRLLRLDGGGWRCVNYRKYRDYRTAKQEATRRRVAKHRSVTRNAGNSGNAPEAEAEAEAEADAEAEKEPHTYTRVYPDDPGPDREPTWVCVIKISEEARPDLAGRQSPSHQRRHAEAIWEACGRDPERVRAACTAWSADPWVQDELPGLAHLAAKLHKYAPANGTGGRALELVREMKSLRAARDELADDHPDAAGLDEQLRAIGKAYVEAMR